MRAVGTTYFNEEAEYAKEVTESTLGTVRKNRLVATRRDLETSKQTNGSNIRLTNAIWVVLFPQAMSTSRRRRRSTSMRLSATQRAMGMKMELTFKAELKQLDHAPRQCRPLPPLPRGAAAGRRQSRAERVKIQGSQK